MDGVRLRRVAVVTPPGHNVILCDFLSKLNTLGNDRPYIDFTFPKPQLVATCPFDGAVVPVAAIYLRHAKSFSMATNENIKTFVQLGKMQHGGTA